MIHIFAISLLMLVTITQNAFTMNQAAGVIIGQDPEVGAIVVAEKSAAVVLPHALHQETQTEGAMLLLPLDLIGNREQAGPGHSIGIQMGQPVRVVDGLKEDSLDNFVREVILDDRKKQAKAAMKRCLCILPFQCVLSGVIIYFTYINPIHFAPQ